MAERKKGEPSETKSGPKARLYEQGSPFKPLGLLIHLHEQDKRAKTDSEREDDRSRPLLYRENINDIRLLLLHRHLSLDICGLS